MTEIPIREECEDNYILTDCPDCGTEHKVHKLRATRGMVRCTNCKCWFIVTSRIVKESVLDRIFGRKRKLKWIENSRS